MNVLLCLNNDGNSKDNAKICYTESGQEMDLNPRICYLHEVHNIFCLGDALKGESPAVSMDIAGNDVYGPYNVTIGKGSIISMEWHGE